MDAFCVLCVCFQYFGLVCDQGVAAGLRLEGLLRNTLHKVILNRHFTFHSLSPQRWQKFKVLRDHNKLLLDLFLELEKRLVVKAVPLVPLHQLLELPEFVDQLRLAPTNCLQLGLDLWKLLLCRCDMMV